MILNLFEVPDLYQTIPKEWLFKTEQLVKLLTFKSSG